METVSIVSGVVIVMMLVVAGRVLMFRVNAQTEPPKTISAVGALQIGLTNALARIEALEKSVAALNLAQARAMQDRGPISNKSASFSSWKRPIESAMMGGPIVPNSNL